MGRATGLTMAAKIIAATFATTLSVGLTSMAASASTTTPPELVERDTNKTVVAHYSSDDQEPEDQQAHLYTSGAKGAPHTATGHGLHTATCGVPASFTINLVRDDGGPALWEQSGDRFIYVWIANEDQILIAEVVDSGKGTMTATYESAFPGNYLIYIEEVLLSRHDEGRPISGSPFSLTITGTPTLSVDELPMCDGGSGVADDRERNQAAAAAAAGDIEETFWRPGTWLSSNVASGAHGVMRNGWVFQPRSCVHETFTYDDLMLLASLEEETWLLVVGGSVQRGVFLTLVDMILAPGQKRDLVKSAVNKCWGYADVRVGNLRVTYQDLRLYTIKNIEDVVICNNEKLASGSSGDFVRSCEDFLTFTAFKSGVTWPAVLLAPSNIGPDPNFAVTVPIEALPEDWTGKLMMVDHMSAYGNHWKPENPTMTSWKDVGMSYNHHTGLGEKEFRQMRDLEDSDPRVSFTSVFPMYQAKLFENQNTRRGVRQYGSSVHYHYVSVDADGEETKGGERMVQSTITEMLANIMVSKAVGSKVALRERVAATPGIDLRSADVRKSFEVCSDCPANLLPFHVKPIPEPDCMIVDTFPKNGVEGEVWNKDTCPSWCMTHDPVSQTPTESGPVDVRECSLDSAPQV